MPKKKPGMTPEEQSERFKSEVERLIAAGELNPTDADAALDGLVRRSRSLRGSGG
jgi:polyhydroxyalkanoate synthesis regulator phasin